jgi:putative pyruvate formate lyase activating enzyme
VKKEDIFDSSDSLLLKNCSLCPRECRVNRFDGGDGFCGMDAGLNISSVCIHKGEEPSISGPKGICNIFFTGCNLHCLFCQNHEISRNVSGKRIRELSLENTLDKIESILSDGINSVGFVSPSHVVPQVKAIIRGLNSRGLKPVTIYNTSSYDTVDTIKSLSGLIDVYLPDFKYATGELASRYSDAFDYPEVAMKAIKQMYYQKGSSLITDNNEAAENGLIIRHLVLPGHVEESKRVLRLIADEISVGVHLSLMSQYHPASEAESHPLLNRPLYRDEYEEVVREMENLGFRNGWVQNMESFENYKPDFGKEDPFEQT